VGIVQLNQIKARVLATCGPLVDVSDARADEGEITRPTRGLAAWVLTQVADVDGENAAAAVTDGFDDNGIDAVLVDCENSVVYLVQRPAVSWSARRRR
jgi:hypothetical protein